MAYDHSGAGYEDGEQEEETPQRVSFFGKFRDWFAGNHDDDEFYEDEPQQAVAQGSSPSTRGHASHSASDPPQTVARVPAPSRHSGGSLNPLRRTGTVAQLRIERPSSVTVRRTVQSFEDVRRAVDGLREGVQQIVNIEQTPSDIAERLIDFLNGATYALDGSVEKIGSQVYLFTPSTVIIDVEETAKIPAAKPFFDRE